MPTKKERLLKATREGKIKDEKSLQFWSIIDEIEQVKEAVNLIKPTDVSEVKKELQRIKEELEQGLDIEIQIV